jgi:hypothetical protein
MKCEKSFGLVFAVLLAWLLQIDAPAEARRFRCYCPPVVVYDVCVPAPPVCYNDVLPISYVPNTVEMPDLFEETLPEPPSEDMSNEGFGPVEQEDDEQEPDEQENDQQVPTDGETELADQEKQEYHFGKRVTLPVFDGGLVWQELDGRIGCGPFAVASLLYALGRDVDQAEFDRIHESLDPDHDGTLSHEVLSYLEPLFVVEERHGASVDDLQRQIDSGLPVLVTVQTDRGPHWALLTGYAIDKLGECVSWFLWDADIVKGETTHEEFLSIWHSEHYQNHCVFVRPRGGLPTSSLVGAQRRPRHHYTRYNLRHTSARFTLPRHQSADLAKDTQRISSTKQSDKDMRNLRAAADAKQSRRRRAGYVLLTAIGFGAIVCGVVRLSG